MFPSQTGKPDYNTAMELIGDMLAILQDVTPQEQKTELIALFGKAKKAVEQIRDSENVVAEAFCLSEAIDRLEECRDALKQYSFGDERIEAAKDKQATLIQNIADCYWERRKALFVYTPDRSYLELVRRVDTLQAQLSDEIPGNCANSLGAASRLLKRASEAYDAAFAQLVGDFALARLSEVADTIGKEELRGAYTMRIIVSDLREKQQGLKQKTQEIIQRN